MGTEKELCLTSNFGKNVWVPHSWLLKQASSLLKACLLKEYIQKRTATAGLAWPFSLSPSPCGTLASHLSSLFTISRGKKMTKT